MKTSLASQRSFFLYCPFKNAWENLAKISGRKVKYNEGRKYAAAMCITMSDDQIRFRVASKTPMGASAFVTPKVEKLYGERVAIQLFNGMRAYFGKNFIWILIEKFLTHGAFQISRAQWELELKLSIFRFYYFFPTQSSLKEKKG